MTQIPQPERSDGRSEGEAARTAPTTGSADGPELRIGGAERDDAISLLQEHLSAGRLDNDEFDERIGKALSARTNGELVDLFTDLPGRRPGQAGASSGYGASDFGYGEQDLGRGKEVAPHNPYEQNPYQATPPTPQTQHGPNWGIMAPGILVPIAVVLCFIIGWQFWWLIPVAAIASSQVSYHAGRRRNREGHQIGQQHGRPWLRQLGSEDAARITDLLHEGKQIQAIKAYREATGTDLVTAKNAVDNWGETLR